MGFRQELIPWDHQPQEVVEVNPELGFVGLVLPGQSRLDLVTGLELSATGATPTQVVGPYGPALLTDANQEYISATATPAQRLTAEGSIVWVGELFAGFSSDASLGGISHNSSNNPPYVTLELKRRGLFVYLSYSFNGGASFGETQLNVGSYTGPAIIVGTYRAGEQRMFMRTPTEVFTAGTIAAGSMGSSATSLWSVGERLNARNPQSSCALLSVADRCWSEAQALAVLNNPWAEAFRPRTLQVPVAAGGGGTTYTQTVSGIFVPSGTVAQSLRFGANMSGSIAPSGVVRKEARVFRLGNLPPAGTIVKQTNKRSSGSVTASGSAVPSTGATMALGGSITLVGALQQAARYVRTYSSILTPSGALRKMTLKGLSGSVAMAGQVAKGMFLRLTGSITPTGEVSGFKFTPSVGSVLSTTLRSIRRFIGRR